MNQSEWEATEEVEGGQLSAEDSPAPQQITTKEISNDRRVLVLILVLSVLLVTFRRVGLSCLPQLLAHKTRETGAAAFGNSSVSQLAREC